ncbi:hypothetical protein [Burkholderia aenigmatica]|uniref:Uncharacterized protein n=1 Tax=Burkholderia aenigmatica TaxID=2015348 RepID=A0A228IJ52_9BURK|nr:hypothetical protein [Burkholderia aenigmatica]OXI42441.1 hypothetical protein CFB84_24845 [Burkholderia aenigmatica]
MNKTLTGGERNAIERAISEVELCCQFDLANELRALLAAHPGQPEPRAEVTDDDKDCADRYRCLRRGQHWSVINGIGDTLRADELDAAIDAARAGDTTHYER